jgi:hypothetical protein
MEMSIFGTSMKKIFTELQVIMNERYLIGEEGE